MKTREHLKEALIKEIKKLNEKVTLDRNTRTLKQTAFLHAVLVCMEYYMEKPGFNGMWEVKNKEGEVSCFSFLDAARLLEKSSNMQEFLDNLKMSIPTHETRTRDYIIEKVLDTIRPYYSLISTGNELLRDLQLTIEQATIPEIDELTKIGE